MIALVTGASGFVGAVLTRRLVEQGREVHLFVRRESNLWRLKDILANVITHEVDLRDAATVERCVAEIRPSVIYHMATNGAFSNQRDCTTIFAANFSGTQNLLKACEQVGFDCFINTGSSSEYGIKTVPMHEKDILEPMGYYGVSKASTTLLCSSEAVQKNLPVVTLRLFSPYGPWDDPKRFIPYVIKSLLRGEAPLLSTPESVRDYVYIDDVVDLYLKVSAKQYLPGEIINVGSGVQSSLGDVVTVLEDVIGNGVEPVWGSVPIQRPEPQCWVADINKAQRHLGWQPSIHLAAGLRNTVAWVREHLDCYP